MAQPIPRLLLAGAADMKIGSRLLRQLQRGSDALQGLECHSYFCRWDLMVCPGWRAVLPTGSQKELPVWTHQQLMANPAALIPLARDLRAHDLVHH